ncbi:MAG: hypothetical protein KKG94_02560 [Nanoarchaeota archaeon]|nr:hypothetical protein [Nanoarchaeota archaeon]
MEFAYYVKSINDLKNIPLKYSRIYLGGEFCSNFILNEREIDQAIKMCKNLEKEITFIVPYIFQKDINKAEKFISYLGSLIDEFEVIFNDWGVFQLIKKQKNLIPIMGRILAKQKTGLDLKLIKMLKLSLYDLDYFKKSAIQSLNDFLIKNSIFRVELNNAPQGLNLEGINPKIKVSIHYPLIYLSTSRYCKIFCSNKKIQLEDLNKYHLCEKLCNNAIYISDKIFQSHKVILQGNTYFIYYNKVPELCNINNANIIDRLVFTSLNFNKK